MFFSVTVYSVHITLLIAAVMNLGDIVQLQFFSKSVHLQPVEKCDIHCSYSY